MDDSKCYRVTESQTPKGTQYSGGGNFFVPDFNKLLLVKLIGVKNSQKSKSKLRTKCPQNETKTNF